MIPFKIEEKESKEENDHPQIKDSGNKHTAFYITGLLIVVELMAICLLFYRISFIRLKIDSSKITLNIQQKPV